MHDPSQYSNLAVRRLADKSKAIEIRTSPKETIEINPDTKTTKGWPYAGITADPSFHPYGWPNKIKVPMSRILAWEEKGLIEIVDREVVVSPAGPKESPWRGQAGTRRNHEFTTGSGIIFKVNVKDPNDDIMYKVARSPGKFYSSDEVCVKRETINRYGEPCEICWDFLLEKVSK